MLLRLRSFIAIVTMAADSILTRTNWEEFLLYIYFGDGSDKLAACIRRAYRDFNRTISGFARLDESTRNKVRDSAVAQVKTSLEELSARGGSIDEDGFDSWHRNACLALMRIYAPHHGFHLGQAQKWLNMSLKYIFTFGSDRIPGFESAYKFCHIPIDNVVLDRLGAYKDFPKIKGSWSRMDDYDNYFKLQTWVRNNSPECPLDFEFHLWMNSEPTATPSNPAAK